MSTYWHFECMDHNPPIQSEEFTQHTNDKHFAANVELALSRPVPEKDFAFHDRSREYFDNQARSFLRSHPDCVLELVNEYGVRRDLTASTVDKPAEVTP